GCSDSSNGNASRSSASTWPRARRNGRSPVSARAARSWSTNVSSRSRKMATWSLSRRGPARIRKPRAIALLPANAGTTRQWPMGGFTPGARRKAFASKSRRRRSDWDRSAQHCGAPDAPLARVHLSFLQGQLTHGFTPHQQPISQLILNKLFTIDLKRLTFPLFDTLATLSPSRAAGSGSGLGLTQ